MLGSAIVDKVWLAEPVPTNVPFMATPITCLRWKPRSPAVDRNSSHLPNMYLSLIITEIHMDISPRLHMEISPRLLIK